MSRYSQVSINRFKDKTRLEPNDEFDFVLETEEYSSPMDDFEFDTGEFDSSDGAVPTETFSLNFEEIKVTYPEAAVLDFALTGDDDFSPFVDDLLF
ncbi:hypothetical protein IWQ49_003630 [Labrenzia sp. EL_126]|nr:hypothetical protein [Labrenzia sp. EL_126]